MTYRSKQFEQAVANLLLFHNFHYLRIENYRCFKCGQVQNRKATGWPDFFVYDPVLLAIECKTGTGKMTQEQLYIREKLINRGVEYIVLRDTVDELIAWIEKF